MRCGCRLSFSLVWAVVDLSVGELGGSGVCIIALRVVQVMSLCIVLVAVVMSGEVGFWVGFVRCLVRVSVLRVKWSELFILAISVPRWLLSAPWGGGH